MCKEETTTTMEPGTGPDRDRLLLALDRLAQSGEALMSASRLLKEALEHQGGAPALPDQPESETVSSGTPVIQSAAPIRPSCTRVIQSPAESEALMPGTPVIQSAAPIRPSGTAPIQNPAESGAVTPGTPVTQSAAPIQNPTEYTLAEVRRALAKKSHEGHTEAVRQLILNAGADRLSQVRPEQYPAIMQALEVME